jgi:hypothetical protein
MIGSMSRADNRIPGLSADNLRAIEAIAAANTATNQALATLVQALAPPALQPAKTPHRRSYRVNNITRGDDGELAGDVEYADGRVRRFRVSRDEHGDLVGELDDAAPDAEPTPAAEAEAEADRFAHVFGDPNHWRG